MKTIKNIHPGEILKEEFLLPLKITAYHLCKQTFIPQTRISEIVKGNRRITADMYGFAIIKIFLHKCKILAWPAKQF